MNGENKANQEAKSHEHEVVDLRSFGIQLKSISVQEVDFDEDHSAVSCSGCVRDE